MSVYNKAQIEDEINEWFFVEYFDQWVAIGDKDAESKRDGGEGFITKYWNAPMFLCAPPTLKRWLMTEEHVQLFFDAQQEPLKARGYTHTDIPDKRVTAYTSDSGMIETIWSRCAGDVEIERVAVNFQVARLEDRWKVVGIHSKYTSADTLDEAWSQPPGSGPLTPSTNDMMDISKLDPELQPIYTMTPTLPFSTPETIMAGRKLYEFFTYGQPGPGVDVREIDTGEALIRTFTPHGGTNGSAILWIHGGGLISGRSNQLSLGASMVAAALGAKVVTVNYRLAPEHPHPAAHEDCLTAWTWMLENAESLGIDQNRIAIAGNSAGGGLAAALAQRIHDNGGPQPVCQVLFYPMLDDRTAADTSRDDEGQFVWSNRENRVAWNAYLAPLQAGAENVPPYASAARRENLKGLPPTWLGVGSVDLFFDEAKNYAERLESVGVDVETFIADGAPHVFEVMAPNAQVSQAFLGSALAYLGMKLAE